VSDGAFSDRRSRLLLVGSVAVAVFMARLDIYMVNISLPTIARDLHVSTSAVSWVSMGYLLFNCGSMMLVGCVADRVSPRAFFVVGYAVFSVTSLLCGLSTSLGMLIACRCAQGVGGAVLIILTYAVVSRFLPSATVGGAMGTLATCGALAIAVGSPVGGFITERLSWQWVFLINVPLGLLGAALAWRCIPRSAQGSRRLSGLDFVGAALSFLAVACLIVALDVGQAGSWGSPLVVLLFALAAILAVLFLVRQMKAKHPLIPPSLLGDRRFALANAITVGGFFLLGGNGFLMPFLLELEKGSSAERAGLVLLSYSATFIVFSPLVGRLADHWEPWRLCAAGMAVGSVAGVAYALTLGAPGSTIAVAFLLVTGAAYALFIPANAKQVLGTAPLELKGVGSAVFGTLNTLSLLLGVSVFETVYSEISGAPARAAAGAAGGGWWVPGFSQAYLVGAGVCALTLVLCFVMPVVSRARPSHGDVQGAVRSPRDAATGLL
jgi:EmrB/QacA subfamily drug resistance transporter